MTSGTATTTARTATAAPSPDGAVRDHDDADTALADELGWVTALMAAHVDRDVRQDDPPPRPPVSPALARLAATWGLTSFERDVLLLGAAVVLDGAAASAGAAAMGTADPRPTVGLALAVLPAAHWDALSPSAPLRHWHLVALAPGPTLTLQRIAVDEPAVHELAGMAVPDPRLTDVLVPATAAAWHAPSHRRAAATTAEAIARSPGAVVVGVTATDATTARDVAPLVLRPPPDGTGVPTADLGAPAARAMAPGELAARLDRHVHLAAAPGLVLVADNEGRDVLGRVLARMVTPRVVVVAATLPPVADRTVLHLDLPAATSDDARHLWRAATRAAQWGPDDGLDHAIVDLAHHHRLSAATIGAIGVQWQAEVAARHTAAQADGTSLEGDTTALSAADVTALRTLARVRARGDFDGLARSLEVTATWDDLVVPDGHDVVLRGLVEHVRQRGRVRDDWGFGGRGLGVRGVTALFTGESGTGKTLAAQVLAHELGVDLHRVDLSQVVDKYIGETEKHLSRVFAVAEASGTVLLFDEADALFGSRGEVREARDRYANLAVAHLLQRMEDYHGLAILTSNLRATIDRAFLRRLRVVLAFPFPDRAQRTRLWQRAFPPATPLEADVDPARLAALALTGGSIASIALAAAVAAAAEDRPVGRRHLLAAARLDAAKHDRVLSEHDVAVLS